MKTARFLGMAALLAAFSSCSITVPVSASSNPVGTKVGVSSGRCYLYVFCFDADASVNSAAKNGGITKISTVDYRKKNFLGLVQVHECIVTGE